MSDGRGTKRELRQAAKAYRAALSPEEICILSRRACGRAGELPAFQRAGTVMLYTAAFGETDPRSLAEEAEKLGKQVCYPVCDGRGGMLAACPGEKWERSSYGIWEPSLSGGCRVVAPGAIDFVLGPGLAFDATGGRLGWGAGYYDRFLKGCAGAFLLGFCYDGQIAEAVPMGGHDVRMDGIVTENGVYLTAYA